MKHCAEKAEQLLQNNKVFNYIYFCSVGGSSTLLNELRSSEKADKDYA